MNTLPVWLRDFLNENSIKIESVLILLSVFSLLLFQFDISNWKLILVPSLILTSTFYFFSAFIPAKEESSIVNMIAYKVINISSSIAILGIMYKLLNLPGYAIMLYIGVSSILIGALVIVFNSINAWHSNTTRIIIRVTLIATFGIIILTSW